MSTKADIVERLREPYDGWAGDALCVSAEIAEEAADLITKLRAEKEDLQNAAEHFRAERDAAARDMRERCAKVCDEWIGEHQHFQPQVISAQAWATEAIEDIAEAIRALEFGHG